MTKKPPAVLIILLSGTLISCASIEANKKLNEIPEDVARGDPINNILVKEYLQAVLLSPENYEVKAYSRRAFSPKNNKNAFVFHMFYVYLKNGKMEHTLVFTATPEGSEYNGSWMLDAPTDIESYNLFLSSPENPWEVEEYQGPKGETALDLIQTTNKILERQEKGYTFFGPASVRNLPWYHLLWLSIIPPPFSPEILMLFTIHTDNCTSAILETMAWKNNETPIFFKVRKNHSYFPSVALFEPRQAAGY
jgi:hypothetical protein